MKKSLAVLLLLLVVGCGSDAEKTLEENTASQNTNTEALNAQNETNEASGDNEKTLPETDHPAETKDSTPNDLAASLRGKRVHIKVGDQGGWFEFHDDGSSYHGRGDERQSGKAQWSARENRVTFFAGTIENHMVFTDLTASLKSEVIFLNSGNEKTKGSIVRVEPIPPASQTPDPGPQPTASNALSQVMGRITYDGKPLSDARIRMLNAVGRIYAAESTKDGSFNITSVEASGTRNGAPTGKYKVLISKYPRQTASDDDGSFNSNDSQLAKSIINEVFDKPSTTPLKLEVKEGKNSFRIDLKSDGTGTVKAL
jgi:hypothetical protein